jgi:HYR domain-containing protein/Big-like domain-containing protein
VTPSQSPNGANGWFTTAPATLHVVASDGNALASLSCTLDGNAVTVANATSSSGDVQTSVDGDHLVVCTATDVAGNSTSTPTQHLKLDTGPPTFAFSQAPNGSNGWFRTSPAKVRVTATDGSGIATLTCKLDGANATLANVATTATTKAGDVSTSAQGDHAVVCTAKDNTGNQVTSTTQHLKLDSVAPTLTVSNITVDPTSASGATVSAYTTTTGDATSPPVTLVCTPAAPKLFPQGDTTVSCTATDQAGNATTKTFRVHVRTVVELVAVLRGMVTGAKPALGGVLVPILTAQLDFVTQYLNWKPNPKPVDACSHLTSFTDRIKTEMMKPKPGMTAAQAKSLTDYANNVIRPLIPC